MGGPLDLCVLLPRAATAGLLGLTAWQAAWNGTHPGHPRGVAAWTFVFFGADAQDRAAAWYAVSNLASPLLLWTVEGYRHGNRGTLFALPSLFGIAAQLLGIEAVAPLYYLASAAALSYAPRRRRRHDGQEQLHQDQDQDQLRIDDPDVASAVLPATALGHVLPSLFMGTLRLTATEVSRSCLSLQSIVCHLFYLSPVSVAVLTRAIASVRKRWRGQRQDLDRESSVSSPASKDAARIADGNGDGPGDGDGRDNTTAEATLSALKTAYAAAFLYQATQHIRFITTLLRRQPSRLTGSSHTRPSQTTVSGLLQYNNSSSSSSSSSYNILSRTRTIAESLINNPPDAPTSSSSSSSSSLLSQPLALYELATLTFNLFTVWDLWRREVVTPREARLAALGCLVGPVLVGPGALSAGLWYWRECVVARKHRQQQQQRRRHSADQKY